MNTHITDGGNMEVELKDDPIYIATMCEDELQQLNDLLWHKGLLVEKDIAYEALMNIKLLKRIMNGKKP